MHSFKMGLYSLQAAVFSQVHSQYCVHRVAVDDLQSMSTIGLSDVEEFIAVSMALAVFVSHTWR